MQSYSASVRRTLQEALCLMSLPASGDGTLNQAVEIAPIVETGLHPEMMLPPVELRRNAQEHCLVERSTNSVRISLKLHAADALEGELVRMWMRFLMQRADSLPILRRVPLQGYDVSFLVTAEHVAPPGSGAQVIDFIVRFIEDCDAEVKRLRLDVNARGRAVATNLLRSLAF